MGTNFFILAAAVAGHAVLGMAWYSSKMFGSQWAESIGHPLEDVQFWEEKKKSMGKVYLWSVILAGIMAYVLASFIALLKIASVSDAVQLSFWLWFGFTAPTGLMTVLFAGTSRILWVINAGYHLASLVIMSIIIVLFK